MCVLEIRLALLARDHTAQMRQHNITHIFHRKIADQEQWIGHISVNHGYHLW